MEYSVGLPVRNEDQNLEHAIEALLGQSITPRFVYVCVNASTNEFLSLAKNIASQEKKVQVLESLPGKANAWNQIMHESSEQYMLFSDGDVLVSKDAAGHLLEHMKHNPSLSLVAGSSYFVKPKTPNFISDLAAPHYNSIIKANHCSGGLYLIHRENQLKSAMRQNKELLPKDIISEDLYLQLIATEDNSFLIDSKAYFKRHPELTVKDYIHRKLRSYEALQQIKEYFPWYANTRTMKLRNVRSYYKKISTLPRKDKVNKINQVLITKLIIPILQTFYSSQGTHWKVPKSTKKSFERN